MGGPVARNVSQQWQSASPHCTMTMFSAKPPVGPQCRAAGFTLIEILLVLSLMGFFLGMASLMPSNQTARDLSFTARQMQQQFGFAADEARAQSEAIGFIFDAKGVSTVYYDMLAQQWQPMLEKPLGLITFTEGINADLQLLNANGSRAGSRQHGQQRSRMAGPDIIIQASGEMSLFRLELSAVDVEKTFEFSSDGLNLRVEERQ